MIHILKLDDDRESVFLFQDMFPITEAYIERAYTIGGNPLYITSEASMRILDKKVRRVLGLIKRGVVFMPTQADAMRIYEQLVEKMNSNKK